MSAWLLLALVSGTPLVSLSDAIDATTALVRAEVAPPLDLAVSAESDRDLAGIERLVVGLIVHRLERALPSPAEVRVLHGGAKDLRAQARDSGAEWLLRVELKREGPRELAMRIELGAVDAGFWWPDHPARVAGVALHRIRIDASLQAWMGGVPARERPALSAPEPWLQLDEAVLDIAGCELDNGSPGEELLVLTSQHLRAFKQSERGLAPWITHRVVGAPAAMRLRAPRGRVLCVPADRNEARVLIGSSNQAFGSRLVLAPSRSAFTVEEQLAGVPLLVQPDGQLLFASPDPDTGAWRLASNGRTVLDVAAPGGRASFLVSPGRYLREDAPAEGARAIAFGGLGGSARADLEPSWITTSSTAWSGTDHITLRNQDGQPIGERVLLPGPIRASGVMSTASGDVIVVVALGSALSRESTLVRLSIGTAGGASP